MSGKEKENAAFTSGPARFTFPDRPEHLRFLTP